MLVFFVFLPALSSLHLYPGSGSSYRSYQDFALDPHPPPCKPRLFPLANKHALWLPLSQNSWLNPHPSPDAVLVPSLRNQTIQQSCLCSLPHFLTLPFIPQPTPAWSLTSPRCRNCSSTLTTSCELPHPKLTPVFLLLNLTQLLTRLMAPPPAPK